MPRSLWSLWELQNIHLKILMSLGLCFFSCVFLLGLDLGYIGFNVFWGSSYCLQAVSPTFTLPDFPEESGDVEEWVDHPQKKLETHKST